MRSHTRRSVLGVISSAGTLALAGCLGGEDDTADGGGSGGGSGFPADGQNILLAIQSSPGGGFDWYGRTLASYIEEYLPGDPTIQPENLSGAGGLEAYDHVGTADPDGSSILLRDMLNSTTQQIGLPSSQVMYDVREYTELATIAVTRMGWVQRSDLPPVDNWDDFVELMTTENIATAGVGHVSHTGPIVMGGLTGAWEQDDLNFVHYDGSGPMMAGISRGEAGSNFYTDVTQSSYINDGEDIEPITSLHPERPDIEFWDSVPTIEQLGAPEAGELVDALGIPRPFSAPSGTPGDIQDVLEEAILDSLNDDDFLAEAAENGRPVEPLDAAETAALQETLYDVWLDQEGLLTDLLG